MYDPVTQTFGDSVAQSMYDSVTQSNFIITDHISYKSRKMSAYIMQKEISCSDFIGKTAHITSNTISI